MNYPIINASLNLTRNCNLVCSYCFSGKNKTNDKMSLQTGKKAIDFLIRECMTAKIEELPLNIRKIDIAFWGGEPLLEWEMLKTLVLYSESVKPEGLIITYGGTTNGLLLTPEKFDFLDKYKIFFMLSIDGTEETHNTFRIMKNGAGSHEIVSRNLKAAIDKWPFFRTRMTVVPEKIHHFFDDVKYLIDLGVTEIAFSPVYENIWTEQHWETFRNEGFKIVDLIAEKQKEGKNIKIEHFASYARENHSGATYPCGAGRTYVGIDIDGSIHPCHRFIKFEDTRSWQEKEWCIGHIDHGITKQEVRDKILLFNPEKCQNKECYTKSPCHGACYAANVDFNGDINPSNISTCKYVEMQMEVSKYYKENVKEMEKINSNDGCVCNNMCYLEGTTDELTSVNPNNDIQCHCYNVNYSGNPNTDEVAKNLTPERRALLLSTIKVTPKDVVDELRLLGSKFEHLSTKIEILIQTLIDRK